MFFKLFIAGDIMHTEKRFKIYRFPSYHGTPWETNSLVLALIQVLLRRVLHPISEILLEDTLKGERFLYSTNKPGVDPPPY